MKCCASVLCVPEVMTFFPSQSVDSITELSLGRGGRRDDLVALLYPTGPSTNSNWGILLSISCCRTGSHQNVKELPSRGCLACSLGIHFGLWSWFPAGWHGNAVIMVAWFPGSSCMRSMSSLRLKWSPCRSATFCWQSSSRKLRDAVPGNCVMQFTYSAAFQRSFKAE